MTGREATPVPCGQRSLLSGIGWNFMFNVGTLLLAGTYTPAEKTRAHGLNSLLVYGANVAASLGRVR